MGLTDPPVWVARCIHCNSMITATMLGQTDATIEHIMPICAGGSTTDLRNLALACFRCNNQKGIRHDSKNLDQRAQEVIGDLLMKRQSQLKLNRIDHDTGLLNTETQKG